MKKCQIHAKNKMRSKFRLLFLVSWNKSSIRSPKSDWVRRCTSRGARIKAKRTQIVLGLARYIKTEAHSRTPIRSRTHATCQERMQYQRTFPPWSPTRLRQRPMSHRNMPTFKALSLTRSSCDYLSLSIPLSLSLSSTFPAFYHEKMSLLTVGQVCVCFN